LVYQTLRKLVRRLEALDVPYAVAGGLALNAHGYRRLTIDLDVLVTAQGRDRLLASLEGLTYEPEARGRKRLRDAEHGVGIDLLIAGKFPGDGQPKPVAFPDPAHVGVEIDGVCYLRLPSLVELKLASGMTNFSRLRDVADVVELIKAIGLPAEFAGELNPYVRDKYLELWRGIQESPVGPDQG
jgi:hypothetical protein